MRHIFLAVFVAGFLSLSFGWIAPGEGLVVYAQEGEGGGAKYEINLREKIGGDDKVTGETGVDLMLNYVSLVYKFAASLIGIICVLIIVISGIQISVGRANNSLVSQSKDRIRDALFSLILLFGSFLVLRTVNPAFFG